MNFTKFDIESIMLYAIPNELTVGDFEVGWNTILSATDKEFMRQNYPK
jgi:serralysin